MPTTNPQAVRDLIAANPKNGGESDAAYKSRIAALGRVATVTDAPAGPLTMVKVRTLDWLFNAVEVKTILAKWDGAIAALAGGDAEQSALSAKLARSRAYMAGTGELDGIDVSDADVRATVAAMVPDILTTDQAARINALGIVTTYAVSHDLTDQQVGDVIAATIREAACDLLRQRLGRASVAAAQLVAAAEADPDATLPEWSDLAAAFGGAE